jgi:hypothetical protein
VNTLCDRCRVLLDTSDTCPSCRVYHGDPCRFCKRRGYHRGDCPEADERPDAMQELSDTIEEADPTDGIAAVARLALWASWALIVGEITHAEHRRLASTLEGLLSIVAGFEHAQGTI